MDENKKLDTEILNFLNIVANKTDDSYIWRECCGFIKEIERVKNLTIPFVVKSYDMCKEEYKTVSKVGGTDYYAKEWVRKNQDDERVVRSNKDKL